MNDDEHLSPEDRELEAELSKLVPSKLKVDFIDELVRDHDRIESAELPKPRRSKWMLPTLAVCSLVFCATTFWKIKNSFPPAVEIAEEKQPATRTDDFVPISSDGFLINASSGGIKNSANGLQQQIELKYEDYHHWHNPDTATNIRIFTPRREIITVPVTTD